MRHRPRQEHVLTRKVNVLLAQSSRICFLFSQARQTESRWVPHWILCRYSHSIPSGSFRLLWAHVIKI